VAEQGWSLMKARLPPSALTDRLMISGSPDSISTSFSTSILASLLPATGAAKLAVTCAFSVP